LFCDDSSEQIIAMLVAECEAGRVRWRRPVRVVDLVREDAGFRIDTDVGPIAATRVVIATGGLSIPKIGASDFAYRIARRFGIRVIEPRPALVPLTFSADAWAPFVELAGVALEVDIAYGDTSFREDLLFTHRGLSGPAVLQISSYWKHGTPLAIDLVPAFDLAADLVATKDVSKQQLANVLADHLPRRLVTQWQATHALAERRVAELPNATLLQAARTFKQWAVTPDGTEGFRKAEVTVGGVDTNELSQQTFEARRVSGLHFIGEAVDVTGWLGGYNFQWAWSSGDAAGRAI
jgi:predicted Rossmann fold flavoprotein